MNIVKWTFTKLHVLLYKDRKYDFEYHIYMYDVECNLGKNMSVQRLSLISNIHEKIMHEIM
jgi:hypothetical protein